MTDQPVWTVERKEQLARLRELLTHVAFSDTETASEADSLLYDDDSFIFFLYDLALEETNDK